MRAIMRKPRRKRVKTSGGTTPAVQAFSARMDELEQVGQALAQVDAGQSSDWQKVARTLAAEVRRK